jgi:hypothetical protein
MTAQLREPGTYRTTAGSLIHFRRTPDGRLVLDLEIEDETLREKLGGDVLVKLSDDPYWPDVQPRLADPELFAD